ncbi:MAG TPA: DNA-3-methyladenine glycosylase I [Planctomycetota bacterium]|nr:DNA-3-methyladenine glycosylase I [Planctomycetota bacterium]
MSDGPVRCHWATTPDLAEYHDREWGVPVHDDRLMFEHIVLDGAQAGLSWLTILRKREGYRRAFANFDAAAVARFTPARCAKLLRDPGIVRNRMKVESAVANARAWLELAEEVGSPTEFLWGFVDGETKVNRWRSPQQIPAESRESQAMSKELRRRGFRFVGPTICYAFMQAAGLVNDHLVGCHRYRECGAARRSRVRRGAARTAPR